MNLTCAHRNTAVERYEQLLEMAETLLDRIDEVAYSILPDVPGRRATLDAVESANEMCARLQCVLRELHDQPVDL